MDTLGTQITKLQQDIIELQRINTLLIERLTSAMDKISTLENNQNDFGYSEEHWSWKW